MKRYTLCTILFACVACCAQGCGKTEYNDNFKWRIDCEESGGIYSIKDNNRICTCSNGDCIEQICNESGKCLECDNGDEKCQNGDYLQCDGMIWHTIGQCLKVDGACENGCVVDDADGNSEWLYKCDSNLGAYKSYCEYGCNSQNLKCKGEPCSYIGEMSCDGDYLKICDNGNYNTIYCPYGCKDGTCNKSHSDTCVNGEIKCETNSIGVTAIYQCQQGKWLVQDVCDFGKCDISQSKCGCARNVCRLDDNEEMAVECIKVDNTEYTKEVVSKCEFECNQERGECNECKAGTLPYCDNGEIISCINGIINKTSCSLGCTNGQCDMCNSDTSQCIDSSTVRIQQCIAGQWVNADAPCEYGCNQNSGECNECQNGGLKCNSDIDYPNGRSFLCENGQWVQQGICGSLGCTPDSTRCSNCEIGSTVCDEDYIATCNDGITYTKSESPCQNGCYEGKCKECIEGQTECYTEELDEDLVEEGIHVCDSVGKWIKQQKCDYGCTNSTCRCEDNTRRCNGNLMQTCQNGEWVNLVAENKRSTYCDARGMASEYCENGILKSKDCPLGCTKGICNECVNAKSQCVIDTQINKVNPETFDFLSKERTFCNNNQWSKETCNDNKCYNGVCITLNKPYNMYNDMVMCRFEADYSQKKEIIRIKGNSSEYIGDCSSLILCSEGTSSNNTICLDKCVKINNYSYCRIKQCSKITNIGKFCTYCNYGVKDGVCYHLCAPNQYRCNGNVLELCTGTNAWSSTFTCKTDTECSADLTGCIKYNSKPQTCTPNTPERGQCNEDGFLEICSDQYTLGNELGLNSPQLLTVYCPYGCNSDEGRCNTEPKVE